MNFLKTLLSLTENQLVDQHPTLKQTMQDTMAANGVKWNDNDHGQKMAAFIQKNSTVCAKAEEELSKMTPEQKQKVVAGDADANSMSTDTHKVLSQLPFQMAK